MSHLAEEMIFMVSNATFLNPIHWVTLILVDIGNHNNDHDHDNSSGHGNSGEVLHKRKHQDKGSNGKGSTTLNMAGLPNLHFR